MALLVRIVNTFFAALFLIAAFISLAFLMAALDGLGRGPEAVWRSSGLAALMAMLATLCFCNVRQAQGRPGLFRIGANIAALLLAAAGMLAGAQVVRWIGGVSALPFLVTLPVLAAARRREPA